MCSSITIPLTSNLKFISNIIIMKEKITHRTQHWEKCAGIWKPLASPRLHTSWNVHDTEFAQSGPLNNQRESFNWDKIDVQSMRVGTKSHCHFYYQHSDTTNTAFTTNCIKTPEAEILEVLEYHRVRNFTLIYLNNMPFSTHFPDCHGLCFTWYE